MNFLIKDDKMLNKYNEVWEKSFGLEIGSFGLDMPQVSPCPTTITKKTNMIQLKFMLEQTIC